MSEDIGYDYVFSKTFQVIHSLLPKEERSMDSFFLLFIVYNEVTC